VLPLSSVDVQVLASQVLGEAVQQKLIPVHIFTSSCLPTVLKQLESRDQGTGLGEVRSLERQEYQEWVGQGVVISMGQWMGSRENRGWGQESLLRWVKRH
jgi:hypothetical protein